MPTVPRHLVERERNGFHAGIEPSDAATLIVVDQTDDEPKVLLGRRHARHVLLPGKFVFPGGRVDATDREMQAVAIDMPKENCWPIQDFKAARMRKPWRSRPFVKPLRKPAS